MDLQKNILSVVLAVLFILFIFFKKQFLGKYLSRLINLNNVLLFYFGAVFLFATIYYSFDLFLKSYSDFQYMTVADKQTKEMGHFFDYIYFSIITQLTIGYGDIFPKFPLVRFFSALQGILGTILTGGIIASIIQYSTILKINKIVCSKSEDVHNEPILTWNILLNFNKRTLYTDIEARLYCIDDGKEHNIALYSKDSLINLNSLYMECSYADINHLELSTRDNRLYFNKIYEWIDNIEAADFQIEEVHFEITELFIEISYAVGTSANNYSVQIRDFSNITKLISDKKTNGKIILNDFKTLQDY